MRSCVIPPKLQERIRKSLGAPKQNRGKRQTLLKTTSYGGTRPRLLQEPYCATTRAAVPVRDGAGPPRLGARLKSAQEHPRLKHSINNTIHNPQQHTLIV